MSFGSPTVRERFPRGVLVDPYGFPEWKLFARAMVRLADPSPGWTADEIRVVDVLAANALLARSGDPLWSDGDPAVKTPEGWTWAHLGRSRDLALVPIELHASYRHAGGMSTLRIDRTRHGLRTDEQPQPAEAYRLQAVAPEVMTELERHLGMSLPNSYRQFFAQTNGAAPFRAGVHPDCGFVADQQFFGLGRNDPEQDIVEANRYVADRLTDEFLAVGYVQGGLILVKVRGEDTDSVWYADDDDYRAEQEQDAAYLCGHLYHRCANSIRQFWDQLSVPARPLLDQADGLVKSGQVTEIRPVGIGDSLPAAYRPAWQPESVSDEEYFANEVIQIAMLRPESGGAV